jgi:PilZ domain
MSVEHRTEPREPLALPVNLAAGGQGFTRDISASGLFFETDSEQQVGGVVDFEIELQTSTGPVRLVAQGKVVRIENNGHRVGVAVQLMSSCLEPGGST